jgi:hypothetical protein
MYSKTNLGADQISGGPRFSRRRKQILLMIAGVVVAALVAVGVYTAVSHDQYGPSANGCVNLTIANSTGGTTLHYCGQQAKSFCRTAYASDDRLSQLGRPQCELAGLTRAKVSAG